MHEDVALVRGKVEGHNSVLCRVSSACLTSTVFDSSDCDCAEQNREALKAISQAARGIFIYLDQEGRGHGLVTKVKAMTFKAMGEDTFTAVESLGLPSDIRTYESAATILNDLGVTSVNLMTNNPSKVDGIRAAGIQVEAVIPCIALDPPPDSLRHLRAKQARGHTL
jgi:3,4-dihydroxy 2-butanone 4-phosphate synthase/GTP cyclohydrolase II